MKKYIGKIFNFIFKTNTITKEKIQNLLKYRNFLDRKNNIFSLLPYANQEVSRGIKELKFKNNTKNAEIFGEILFENLLEYLEDLKIREDFYDPILITVPISFWRKIKRGYNQNDLITQSFMKLGGKNFIKWEKNNLIKVKHTKPQSLTKNKAERLRNQKGAFKLKKPEKIKNKNVILFDDIYTTGATISEIKKVLKKAGVKKIKVVVLAN